MSYRRGRTITAAVVKSSREGGPADNGALTGWRQGSAALREAELGPAMRSLLDTMPPGMMMKIRKAERDALVEDEATSVSHVHPPLPFELISLISICVLSAFCVLMRLRWPGRAGAVEKPVRGAAVAFPRKIGPTLRSLIYDVYTFHKYHPAAGVKGIPATCLGCAPCRRGLLRRQPRGERRIGGCASSPASLAVRALCLSLDVLPTRRKVSSVFQTPSEQLSSASSPVSGRFSSNSFNYSGLLPSTRRQAAAEPPGRRRAPDDGNGEATYALRSLPSCHPLEVLMSQIF